MNAVEIEEAISALAERPFDGAEFPFAFLQAFGNKETTLKRLRKGETNKSDLGGVLQTSNIHIAGVPPGEVTQALAALKTSPATTRAKAKFVLATDGETFEAEDLTSGETIACAFAEFPDHFGFFLPLAGITTVKQVRENAFDIRATGRLNRLYVELLKTNPEWGTSERRHDMNHFMARLTVAIVGLSRSSSSSRRLFDVSSDGETTVREAVNITPYLTTGENVIVTGQRKSIAALNDMSFGNMPVDGGNLLMTAHEVVCLGLDADDHNRFIRRIFGSAEFIRGLVRYCLWVSDEHLERSLEIETIRTRIDRVRVVRLASKDAATREMASRAHQFREMHEARRHTLILPGVSSEGREYLPVGLLDEHSTVSNLAFALYDASVWNLALIASRLHLVWIATVCGKLKTDFRYSNTLGWSTFPVPTLTEKNKADLTRCAEDILLAREAHFPATIADLYDPEKMPADLREAHGRNDEALERIYIGRRFRNDTERLEKLFELYTKSLTKKALQEGLRAELAK